MVVREAPRLLGTAAALNAWEKANREAHDPLRAVVRGDVADRAVSLDLGEMLQCFAGAIWLGSDRRRTVLNVGICLIVAGIAVLALRRLGERAVVDSVAKAPNAGAAADDAWNVGTSLMVDAAHGSMLFGLFIVSGDWLAGPARWAAAVRRVAAPAFREYFGLVRAGLGS